MPVDLLIDAETASTISEFELSLTDSMSELDRKRHGPETSVAIARIPQTLADIFERATAEQRATSAVADEMAQALLAAGWGAAVPNRKAS